MRVDPGGERVRGQGRGCRSRSWGEGLITGDSCGLKVVWALASDFGAYRNTPERPHTDGYCAICVLEHKKGDIVWCMQCETPIRCYIYRPFYKAYTFPP